MKRRREAEGAASPSTKLTRLSETSPCDGKQATSIKKAVIYLVEKRIPSSQLSLTRTVAKRKNISLSDSFDSSVTHVVSALPSYELTENALDTSLPDGVSVVNLQCKCVPLSEEMFTDVFPGLTASFREGRPLENTEPYKLARAYDASTTKTQEKFELPEYECQRSTLLHHHNTELTEALELMESYYQYKDDESRALAFRQASCSLKTLPWKVTSVSEVCSLPRIGQHSKNIIEEVLDLGYSVEVEKCTGSEWFNCMKLFTSVYGCGSRTAQRWYEQGLRTLQDVTTCTDLPLTDTQKLGLKYYRDISQPIPRSETAIITDIIRRQAEACFPGTSVEAVGGYRRGKPYSHDVDLLLTHQDTAITDCLLQTLLTRLQTEGMVIHADVTTGQNSARNIQHDHATTSRHTFTPGGKQRRVVFDHLDKAFCILKLGTGAAENAEEAHQERAEGTSNGVMDTPEGVKGEKQTTMIRRVDLIVSPPDQYPFALVSWTGSKQFNRSLRRYSVKECGMSVTAHGIYSISEGKFQPASTERDVFSTLNLTYREPSERNC